MIAKQKNIVCFGEVLWDLFPSGKKLGGAPFNVAAHTAQHGYKSYIISAIGNDQLGEEILKEVQSQGVYTKFIQINSIYKTGTVEVTLNREGIPSYYINKPVAWDFISFNLEMIKTIQKAEAFVFGSLASRSEQSKNSLTTLLTHAALKVCDLNIRQQYFNEALIKELLSHANILKINDEEADLLKKLFGLESSSFYRKLAETFNIDIIIQTMGANGAEAWRDDRVYRSPGYKVRVVDTVGSGDAFLSSFIHHFLDGQGIDHCLTNACKLGAFVATQNGAVPEYDSDSIVPYTSDH